MNKPFDMRETAMAYVQSLSRGDQCEFANDVLKLTGPGAPIPVFEDVRMDADGWCVTTDLQTQTIYLVAMWSLWDAEKQQQCIEWLQKNKKEAAK